MRLVAFDFDGTLSADEMIDDLGERHGVAEEIGSITERAMAGELPYAESLRRRVGLLEGMPVAAAEEILTSVRLQPGAAELLSRLNGSDTTTAILTGGFERGVEAALSAAGVSVDEIVANRLIQADGVLTGRVEGRLVDGDKANALRRVATESRIPLDRAVAVGDGANDIPMLRLAGVGVGYDPTPTVADECDVIVHSMPELAAVLEEHGALVDG